MNKESEMGEVKRYDAVHIRYEDHNIRYGEGCEVEMVAAQDYDALRAETYLHEVRLADAYEAIERLRAENAELVAALESIDTLVSEVIGADSGDRRILGKIEDEISAALSQQEATQ